ncbi:MAG TPA: bacterial transcriptional activator domain-containing protein [Acidimicrobiales bacterium]|nr:bacterial transcriptional activator domain-containing protein [Acidimicrobiales bacterium]
MAAHSQHLKRVVAPLQGSALTVYFVLLPYVVVTKWHRTQRQNDGALVRGLLIALALFWLAFLFQVVRDVWRLRRGATAGTGGSAWIATGVVALLAFLTPSSAGAVTNAAVAPHSIVATTLSPQSHSVPVKSPQRTPGPLSSTLGAMPLALMAKRRSDLIRQHQFVDDNDEIEESIELLRSLNPTLLDQLREMIGERCDGVIDVPNDIDATTPSSECADAYVACALVPSPQGTLVSFAREGGVLAILPTWSSRDVIEATVALHSGRLVFADNENELLRALATRSVRRTLVVYLGERAELDEELIACSITLTPYREQPRALRTSAWSNVAAQSRGGIRVELLRAEVHVVGLCEPLTPTLRRRGVEMLAYLAMHRHEPITGERLRTRVLTHADVDASLRTLANTASVVRRSAGCDDQGPRLHAVTSSGLYVTHGITSDVEVFTTLVARARELSNAEAAPLAHQALAMVKGEPLASALRGFEWFLAEGFSARLSRDGEWAALALHHDALENGRFELAFWALQQGLLVDPYSDVLLEASARVPRLREFGRDGRGLAQHETVGPSRAVSMSWSLNGFSNQVTK